jgi:tetratricopeptide (TPR) repeat protein
MTDLVELDYAQGRRSEALKRCREVIAKYPDEAMGYYLAGRVIGIDNPDEAENAYEKAIALNPQWQQPQNALATLYLQQNQKDKAIERLQTDIHNNPNNIGLYLTLAQIYLADEESDLAMDVYRQTLQQHPNLWPALNNLAFLQSEYAKGNEDLEMARDIAQKALAQQPQNPVVLDTLGWIHYRLGNIGEALALLEQAVEKLPTDKAVINYHLAAALHAAGRNAEARVLLEKALSSGEPFIGNRDAEALMRKIS